ncbi:carbohydrate ABC transporter permease [Ruania rhizosphaerae]|uniref:carbohydrate ABC transporter permease n=1 Tax=Ruania rhizosphaerae TaxID=1840413 RepID=UPI00135A08D6|nr:carbohydrate ABC transporter permease [Ruania rhizosphaerae]
MIVDRRARAAHYTAVIIGAIIMAAPLLWMVTSAFKSPAEVIAYPPTWWPESLQLSNVTAAFEILGARAFVNSALFAIVVVTVQGAICLSAGFALAKLRFRGAKPMFTLFVTAMLVPPHVMLLPMFLVVKEFDLLNTYVGLMLPIVAQTGFGTFLFRQYFTSLPDEMVEAARVDGAHWGQVFLRIAAPLARPAVAAYAAISLLNAWTMYAWPLVAARSSEMRVLPLVLAPLATSEHSITPISTVMMAVLLTTLPMLIVFLAAQNQFVKGLGGAVKE